MQDNIFQEKKKKGGGKGEGFNTLPIFTSEILKFLKMASIVNEITCLEFQNNAKTLNNSKNVHAVLPLSLMSCTEHENHYFHLSFSQIKN